MTGWHRDGQAWCATARDADEMRALGADLVTQLAPGDVLILDGPLGAGKTTFTQGVGTAMSVRGSVTSPTFVIAREPPRSRPLARARRRLPAPGSVEVDDLDLDADLERAVTVVEWGAGKVEGLAPDRLEVLIRRDVGSPVEPRTPRAVVRTAPVRGWVRGGRA